MILVLALLLAAEPAPTPEQVALTASWCAYSGAYVHAVNQIKRERRLAEIGGVLDARRVAYWQRIAGEADDWMTEHHGAGGYTSCRTPPGSCVDWSIVRGRLVLGWSSEAPCRTSAMEAIRLSWAKQ